MRLACVKIADGLIDGNRIEPRFSFHDLFRRQESGGINVRISAVSVKRVGEAGNDGDVVTIRTQRPLTSPELVVPSFPFGKPVPLLMLRVFFWWEAHSIRKKDECRSIW